MSTHRLRVLSLAAAFVALGAAQDNQCFYAANQRAGSIIVPCSSTGPFASCCQLGDLCLSDSACWNPAYNVTYLYGCTDPSYKDFTCPYKCGPTFADAPYVGLDYCSNTTNYEWSCTHPKNNDQAIQPFDFAAPCLNDSIIAFAGPVSLPPYLSLPQSIGGSTLYFSPTAGSYIPVTGYTPTTTAQVTASVPSEVEYVGSTTPAPSTSAPSPSGSGSPSATASGSATTTTNSAASGGASSAAASSNSAGSAPDNGTTSPPSSSNAGLKIGLGVGIAGGVLFLAALTLFFLMWRRRRNRHAAIPQHEADDARDSGGALYGTPAEKNMTPYQDSPAVGAGRTAGGFGHQRQPSELEADSLDRRRGKPAGSPNMTTSTQRSPVPQYSEFEGSPAQTQTQTQTQTPATLPQPRYELGDSR